MIKKLPVNLFLLLALAARADAPPEALLQQADSLFAAQQFTESFVLYDSLYRHYHTASPAMLLKMAYIKEGLGDITMAEYYLNEYYLATKNEQALQKMADLAATRNLEGYEHNDLSFFFNLYYKNYEWLVAGLALICLMLGAMLGYQKLRHHSVSANNLVFLVIFMAALFWLVNFGREYNRGIIIKNNTFVMAAPSAGADLLDVTGKGHKVIVRGREDVWYQIDWKGRTGYVKQNQVRLLQVW